MNEPTSPEITQMLNQLTLQQQVALRLIVGYQGYNPESEENQVFLELLGQGLGGVIFFRENFETLTPTEPASVARLITHLYSLVPEGLPKPLMGIDQEGGPVERLPHFLFPSAPSPKAVALALADTDNNEFAAEVYDLTAYYLAQLGFTLNCFPTLDVNLAPNNPVIGVRSFGSTPETVWRFAQVVLERLKTRSIVAVGKHFPGHGNGTVDSHLSMPVLNFTEGELDPFRRAIESGLPAMMISHGHYPALQTGPEEANLPASASKAVIQGLLRTQLGFTGVTLSDDMVMGAITQNQPPVDAALAALNAGCDMLIYRHADTTVQQVACGIAEALRTGTLDKAAHEAAVARILALKQAYPPRIPNCDLIEKTMSPQAVQAVTEFMSDKALTVLHEDLDNPALMDPETLFWLVYPNREALPQYAMDCRTSPDLKELMEEQGFSPVYDMAYTPGEALPVPSEADSPELLIFVTFNPDVYPEQEAFYREFRAEYPDAHIVVAAAGLPDATGWSLDSNLCLALCSWRPDMITFFADYVVQEPEPVAELAE